MFTKSECIIIVVALCVVAALMYFKPVEHFLTIKNEPERYNHRSFYNNLNKKCFDGKKGNCFYGKVD